MLIFTHKVIQKIAQKYISPIRLVMIKKFDNTVGKTQGKHAHRHH